MKIQVIHLKPKRLLSQRSETNTLCWAARHEINVSGENMVTIVFSIYTTVMFQIIIYKHFEMKMHLLEIKLNFLFHRYKEG